MKKLFIVFCLFFGLTHSSYAQYVVTCPTCASLPVQLFEKAIDVAMQSKEFILDPLVSTLAGEMLQQFQQDTIRWIKSGFQGGGPAFIVNPNAYFKNLANKEIEFQLNSLKSNQNVFSNSVIGNVITSIRGARSVTGAQIQYTLGNTIQNSLCTEANLNKLATESVDGGLSVGTGSDSRESQIANRKAQLRSQLCGTNATNNVATQKKLSTCFDNNFYCGGWSAWLDLTTNPSNSQYGQTIIASQNVAKTSQQKQTLASQELVNGLMPKKKCTKYGNGFDDEGNSTGFNQICIEEEVEIPALTVASQLTSTIQGAVDKITNADEISELLSQLAINYLKQTFYTSIKTAINGNGVNSSSVGTLSLSPNGNITTTRTGTDGGSATFNPSPFNPSSGIPVDTGNPAIDNLKKNMQTDLQMLTDNKKITDDFDALINAHKNKLTSIEVCTNEIQILNPALYQTPTIQGFLQYVAKRRADIPVVYGNMIAFVQKITPNIAYLNTSIAKLVATISLEDLAILSQGYATKSATQDYQDSLNASEIEKKVEETRKNIETEETNNTIPRVGQCTSMLADLKYPQGGGGN
jgi:hypothetical protein